MSDIKESRILMYKKVRKSIPDLSIPKITNSRTSDIEITVALPITFEGMTILSLFEVKIPPIRINASRPRIIAR